MTGEERFARWRGYDRVCRGKRKFPGYGEAWAAMDSLRRRDGSDLNVYKCFFCGWHHFGHTPSNGGKLDKNFGWQVALDDGWPCRGWE